MQVLYCDVCKSAIDDPTPDVSIFHISDYALCEGCKDDLEFAMRPILRNNAPFETHWHVDNRLHVIADGVSKGRIAYKR